MVFIDSCGFVFFCIFFVMCSFCFTPLFLYVLFFFVAIPSLPIQMNKILKDASVCLFVVNEKVLVSVSFSISSQFYFWVGVCKSLCLFCVG